MVFHPCQSLSLSANKAQSRPGAGKNRAGKLAQNLSRLKHRDRCRAEVLGVEPSGHVSSQPPAVSRKTGTAGLAWRKPWRTLPAIFRVVLLDAQLEAEASDEQQAIRAAIQAERDARRRRREKRARIVAEILALRKGEPA